MILQDQIKIFCYSGLIPFIFIPIISWISPKTAFEYYLILLFFTWSMMMATFMAGTLWGLSIKSNKSILSSIIIFPNEDNIVPLIIYIWLSLSIILEQLNKKKDS